MEPRIIFSDDFPTGSSSSLIPSFPATTVFPIPNYNNGASNSVDRIKFD